MRVKSKQRNDATLLMFQHREDDLQNGELLEYFATSYTVARWHSLPQSNVWQLLQQLIARRLVKRSADPEQTKTILYSLTKRGRTYVEKHLLECNDAHRMVMTWKVQKYKRGLSK